MKPREWWPLFLILVVIALYVFMIADIMAKGGL
jgi:hypothetical protein